MHDDVMPSHWRVIEAARLKLSAGRRLARATDRQCSSRAFDIYLGPGSQRTHTLSTVARQADHQLEPPSSMWKEAP